MTTRYQHPHLMIQIVLPIDDGMVSKGQVIQLKDLKDALEVFTAKMENPKGKQNGRQK